MSKRNSKRKDYVAKYAKKNTQKVLGFDEALKILGYSMPETGIKMKSFENSYQAYKAESLVKEFPSYFY
jgi:hypothetical protein